MDQHYRTQVTDVINEAYMDGVADMEAGNVDYGPGHYVFHKTDGVYWVLHTSSTGAQELVRYMGERAWHAFYQALLDTYAELDADQDEDGYVA